MKVPTVEGTRERERERSETQQPLHPQTMLSQDGGALEVAGVFSGVIWSNPKSYLHSEKLNHTQGA